MMRAMTLFRETLQNKSHLLWSLQDFKKSAEVTAHSTSSYELLHLLPAGTKLTEQPHLLLGA